MCHDQNYQFQHVWNALWSKLSALVCIECLVVKNLSFSIAGVCRGQNRPFQYACNVLAEKNA
jgi:hypothetical protein